MKIKDSQVAKDALAAARHQLKYYDEMMDRKNSTASKYIDQKVEEEMQPFYDAFKKETNVEKKLFVVDTITSFRNRYVIEAESLEHAYDEVSMLDSGNDNDLFDPFSQKALPEQILDGKEISKKKFDKMIKELEETGEGSPWMGEKLIHRIDYSK